MINQHFMSAMLFRNVNVMNTLNYGPLDDSAVTTAYARQCYTQRNAMEIRSV